MNILFTKQSWDDYTYWQKNDKNILKRTNLLIQDILRSPFEGIGKPEPLKYQLQGTWSRRINDEHRIIYEVVGDELRIISCRFHYE